MNGNTEKKLAKHHDQSTAKDAFSVRIFIDKGCPFIACQPNTLSDGSVVYDIYFRGNPDPVPAISAKAAEDAMTLFAKALEVAAGERPLIL